MQTQNTSKLKGVTLCLSSKKHLQDKYQPANSLWTFNSNTLGPRCIVSGQY